MVVLVIVGLLWLEWRDRRSAEAGPRQLKELRLLSGAGPPRFLLTTAVTVEESGLLGGHYDLYRLDAVEATSGAIAETQWWPEKNDRPYCQSATPELIWCRSRAVGFAVLEASTLKRIGVFDSVAQSVPVELAGDHWVEPESGGLLVTTKNGGQAWLLDPFRLTAAAISEARARTIRRGPACSRRTVDLDGVHLQLRNVLTGQRQRVHRQKGTARSLCREEYIEPEFLCEQGETMKLSGPRAVVLSHRSSLITNQTTQLRFTPVTPACKERWTISVPFGRVVASSSIDDALILGIARTKGQRDTVAAYDLKTGKQRWDLKL